MALAASPSMTPFQAVFGTSFDAVLILDGDGVVSDANPAAVKMLGRRRASIVGRPVAKLLADGDASAIPGPGASGRFPVVFSLPRGETLECDVAVSGDLAGTGRVLVARERRMIDGPKRNQHAARDQAHDRGNREPGDEIPNHALPSGGRAMRRVWFGQAPRTVSAIHHEGCARCRCSASAAAWCSLVSANTVAPLPDSAA